MINFAAYGTRFTARIPPRDPALLANRNETAAEVRTKGKNGRKPNSLGAEAYYRCAARDDFLAG